ncbi:MAG: hypothetical protein KGQ66_18390 [Acidobacteriota bacterium]|nr:hypothetical protein [Acidobacteriota bacterium]
MRRASVFAAMLLPLGALTVPGMVNAAAAGAAPARALTATWSGLPGGPVDWGSAVKGALTVTNTGTAAMTAPEVVTIKPADPTAFNQAWLGYSTASGYAPQYCGWAISSGVPDGLSCTLYALAPGAAQVIALTAYPVAPAGGPLQITASTSTGDLSLTSPAISVTGTGAVLSASISNPPTVQAGATFARSYTITNRGSTEATGVMLSDRSYAFSVRSTQGPGSCVYASAYRVGGRINCSFGTVPPHSSVTLVATLAAPITSSTSTTYTSSALGSTTSPFVASSNLTTSSTIKVITYPAANVTPPKLTGTPQVGQVLTATWGTWTGTGTISVFAKLCHSSGTGCSSDIASTYTQSTRLSGQADSVAFRYTVTPSDVGTHLVLYVSAASAAGGSRAVTTAAVGPVTP